MVRPQSQKSRASRCLQTVWVLGEEGKEGRRRKFYMDDLVSHFQPTWRQVPLVLRLSFSGNSYPSDRDVSSLSSLPCGGGAGLPLGLSACLRECLLQVLLGTFVAMVPPELTGDAKNKFQMKLSSCLGKESFLFSLYLYPIGSELMCSEKLDLIQMPCPESADGLWVEGNFIG